MKNMNLAWKWLVTFSNSIHFNNPKEGGKEKKKEREGRLMGKEEKMLVKKRKKQTPTSPPL